MQFALPAPHVDIHPALRQPYITPPGQVLHMVCAISNPQRFASRYRNYQIFEKHMQESGVNLITVELALRDRDFEITNKDNLNHVQVRCESELWHKENLLRLGISRFPSNWAYGGYLDADFLMTRSDWALETIQQLQHYSWVQLFSTYSDLQPDGTNGVTNKGFVKAWREGQLTQNFYYALRGAPGGGWAFRREAYDVVGGLLDICILGSSDWHMAVGLTQCTSPRHQDLIGGLSGYAQAINIWREHAKAIRMNVGYIDNHALHLYHGKRSARGYGSRTNIMKRHLFDPYVDIKRDWQGVYIWSGNKPILEQDVRQYFISRDEDK